MPDDTALSFCPRCLEPMQGTWCGTCEQKTRSAGKSAERPEMPHDFGGWNMHTGDTAHLRVSGGEASVAREERSGDGRPVTAAGPDAWTSRAASPDARLPSREEIEDAVFEYGYEREAGHNGVREQRAAMALVDALYAALAATGAREERGEAHDGRGEQPSPGSVAPTAVPAHSVERGAPSPLDSAPIAALSAEQRGQLLDSLVEYAVAVMDAHGEPPPSAEPHLQLVARLVREAVAQDRKERDRDAE